MFSPFFVARFAEVVSLGVPSHRITFSPCFCVFKNSFSPYCLGFLDAVRDMMLLPDNMLINVIVFPSVWQLCSFARDVRSSFTLVEHFEVVLFSHVLTAVVNIVLFLFSGGDGSKVSGPLANWPFSSQSCQAQFQWKGIQKLCQISNLYLFS